MAVHELKTWPTSFAQLLTSTKTVEIRRDDRGFAVGDVLILREWDPDSEAFSGRSVRRIVTAIFSDGDADWSPEERILHPEYVLMSIVEEPTDAHD